MSSRTKRRSRSEEHTSELQSQFHLVCRLLLEKKNWTDPPTWLAHQAAMHGQAHSQARSDPGYAGLVGWAGFDYSSLLGPGPYDIKWAGVADGFRVPKPGAAIYQTQGDPAVRPVIVPVFFWEAAGPVPSYGPPPGQTAMIASNCERR